MTEKHDDSPYDGPSKSQLKREASAAQRLGERLIGLNDELLGKLDLPEKLVDAIQLARTIKAHGALRRQRQYIGKLMRDMDTSMVEAVIHELDEKQAFAAQRLHQAENWRERLLEGGDDALADFLEQHPQADRQQLRQLVRSALSEQRANKPPKHFRTLFKLLRDLLDTDE